MDGAVQALLATDGTGYFFKLPAPAALLRLMSIARSLSEITAPWMIDDPVIQFMHDFSRMTWSLLV